MRVHTSLYNKLWRGAGKLEKRRAGQLKKNGGRARKRKRIGDEENDNDEEWTMKGRGAGF